MAKLWGTVLATHPREPEEGGSSSAQKPVADEEMALAAGEGSTSKPEPVAPTSVADAGVDELTSVPEPEAHDIPGVAVDEPTPAPNTVVQANTAAADAGAGTSLPEPVNQQAHAVEKDTTGLMIEPAIPVMSSINFVRIYQTANPLRDYLYELNGEQFRFSPVVYASGSEEHLNQSSRDMVTLRRACLCNGHVPDVGETCPSIMLAMTRVREDNMNCCTLLETIDPFVWLPALSEAWRQPGAVEDHASSTPSKEWVTRYVLPAAYESLHHVTFFPYSKATLQLRLLRPGVNPSWSPQLGFDEQPYDEAKERTRTGLHAMWLT